MEALRRGVRSGSESWRDPGSRRSQSAAPYLPTPGGTCSKQGTLRRAAPPMPRELRQAQNRELLRQVNDRIADASSTFEVPGDQRFICECAQLGCTAQIE